MKKWHAETTGECDVHRYIYEEGNPKPIAPPIMFDAANALVAAHNGEQEELGDAGATEECQHYVRDGISTHYSDESLSYTVTGTCQKCRAVVERELTDIERKGGPTRQWRIVSAPSPAITRANKARDEQSAPAAEQPKFTSALHHPSCRPSDVDLVWHCSQCGLNELAETPASAEEQAK